jgi:type II secretory pathway component GspD/PulD (secretin)
MTTPVSITPARLVLIVAAFVLTLAAHAQPTETTDCSQLATRSEQEACRAKYSQPRTIYLTNISTPAEANEIVVAVRNIFDPSLKVYLLASQNAITLSTYPQEFTKIEAFVHALDRPHKTYRLTYTIAETDSGKRIGVEHFSIIAVDGQRTTLKQGDKIPVATGSFSTENSASQTQFTYLDVGMSFDSTITSTAAGLILKSKVEQSSVGPSNTIAGVQEPVVRQAVLEGVSTVTPNKPLMLGSIDVPNSTRHLDIDVLAEPLP